MQSILEQGCDRDMPVKPRTGVSFIDASLSRRCDDDLNAVVLWYCARQLKRLPYPYTIYHHTPYNIPIPKTMYRPR